MKQTSIPDIDQCLDRAIADGRRRRADDVSREAATRRLVRYGRLRHTAVSTLCVIATVLVFYVGTPLPDAKYSRSDISHHQLLAISNQYIAYL